MNGTGSGLPRHAHLSSLDLLRAAGLSRSSHGSLQPLACAKCPANHVLIEAGRINLLRIDRAGLLLNLIEGLLRALIVGGTGKHCGGLTSLYVLRIDAADACTNALRRNGARAELAEQPIAQLLHLAGEHALPAHQVVDDLTGVALLLLAEAELLGYAVLQVALAREALAEELLEGILGAVGALSALKDVGARLVIARLVVLIVDVG